MIAYAFTIFLSAFLLFEVQPMIGKIILPWFGGAAAVWSTCMLFFQAALLAGYLYAHAVIKYLKPKQQAILHVALLASSLAILPILPSPSWKPTQAGDPSLRILLLLASTIGLPYMLLSTTSPLLQAWYARTRPGTIPYRFFALSNLGSLLALVSFPAIVEPRFTTHVQAYSWSGVYAAFVVVCALVAWTVLRAHENTAVESYAPAEDPSATSAAPSLGMLSLWTALAAVASVLLLAITTHLSQNVAPIPLLWVVPLGVYLLTFILCFEREKIYHRGIFLPLFAAAIGGMAFATYWNEGNANLRWAIPLFVAGLFVCCMVCHGELTRLKPDPKHLTSFYLMVSVGGALGGFFVAIFAPHVFRTYFEMPLGLVLCPALATVVLFVSARHWSSRVPIRWVQLAMMTLTVGVAGYLGYQKLKDDRRYVLSDRDYYGVSRVIEEKGKGTEGVRKLIHGTIDHGEQLTNPPYRRVATTYYGADSGIGRAIRFARKTPSARVGMIGLGAGVTASYCRPGDFFTFYEINPLALQIATTWFSFVNDCPGEHHVYLGDARLVLESQSDMNYDVLGVDAFTSDAIPVHLLTREAFAVYFRHLKPSGILSVHVSNRYLNLMPVVARNAVDMSKAAILVADAGDEEDYLFDSDWVLVTGDPAVFNDPIFRGNVAAKPQKGLRPWTDDFSNLYQILGK